MWAKRFLESVAYDRKNYPRLPKKVRGEAHSILRHFPSEWDMERASNGSPDVFQKRMEPVSRLIQQYEQSKAEKNEA
jgi:hypothetical protein